MVGHVRAYVCGGGSRRIPAHRCGEPAAHQADAVRAWLLGQREAVERAVRREAHDNLDRGVVTTSCHCQAADAVLAVLTGGDR